ncbi:MAG: secretin N-terminal domain-containing protein [Methylophilaceae bacterium]
MLIKDAILGLLMLFCSLGNVVAHAEFKIITLQHRFAKDILPTIQPMVGVDGSASAVDNNLLIRATPEQMSMIEQVIATFDVERRNLRITISHDNNQQSQRNRVGATGSGRIGNVQVQVPRGTPDGVQLDIGQDQRSISQQGSEFVTVIDGERAFIRVGQSVPFTQQWVQYSQRYLNVQTSTQFQDITTGFAVRPRAIGNVVELEITPRIARLNSMQFIDFEELSTVVRVAPGQWFDLGGTMQSRDEVSRAILSRQADSGSQSSTLKVRIDE